MVELNESFVELSQPAVEGEDTAAPATTSMHAEPAISAPSNVVQAFRPAGEGGQGGPGGGQQEPAGPPLGDQAEGVQKAGRILAAATGARWPMYLRNVKQILRQADGGFDERRYGFGGLMDLLKGCQREGFVRVERDRRGGLRVFQGPALQGTASTAQVSRPNLPQPDVEEYENQPIEAPRALPADSGNTFDGDQDDSQPLAVLVDTTAELLGRAKPRKPRARAARPAPAAAPKMAAARKPAAKKPARGKKAHTDDAGNR